MTPLPENDIILILILSAGKFIIVYGKRYVLYGIL